MRRTAYGSLSNPQARQVTQPIRRIGGQNNGAPPALPRHKMPVADLSVN